MYSENCPHWEVNPAQKSLAHSQRVVSVRFRRRPLPAGDVPSPPGGGEGVVVCLAVP